jgi:hypothetical protein
MNNTNHMLYKLLITIKKKKSIFSARNLAYHLISWLNDINLISMNETELLLGEPAISHRQIFHCTALGGTSRSLQRIISIINGLHIYYYSETSLNWILRKPVLPEYRPIL